MVAVGVQLKVSSEERVLDGAGRLGNASHAKKLRRVNGTTPNTANETLEPKWIRIYIYMCISADPIGVWGSKIEAQ